MRVVYTKHAERKFKFLKALDLNVNKTDIKDALTHPDYFYKDTEREANVVMKKIDQNHNLRVVYFKENDIITVITFYPTKKGRYIK